MQLLSSGKRFFSRLWRYQTSTYYPLKYHNIYQLKGFFSAVQVPFLGTQALISQDTESWPKVDNYPILVFWLNIDLVSWNDGITQKPRGTAMITGYLCREPVWMHLKDRQIIQLQILHGWFYKPLYASRHATIQLRMIIRTAKRENNHIPATLNLLPFWLF